MGKTIRLTEEQIMRFFGPGFGRVILGESNEPNPYDKMGSIDPKKLADASKNYVKGMNNPNKDSDAQSSVGFNYTSREGKDLPGYGGSVAKVADFGAADLNSDNAALNNNQLLEAIREIHGDGALNIIDVLDILHQLKNKKLNSGDEKAKDAFEFLNSVNIDYILSNFITVNAPDYVFWRLKSLTPEEIARIKKVYKRDFSGFGQRCDGCGASVWKTTVTPFEHDDAHINMEYWGSEAADNGTGFAKVNEEAGGGRKFYTYRIPFQIHHMNENPGDNNPLNLSCLCPNCHTITGSYGKGKTEMTDDTFKMLGQLEDMLGGEKGVAGSLTDLMDEDEKKKIVKSLKSGEFEKRSYANSIMGVDTVGEIMLDPSEVNVEYLKQCGIDDVNGFIDDFNSFFEKVYSDGFDAYTKHHKLLKEDAEEQPGVDDDDVPESDKDAVKNDVVQIGGIEVNYEVRCTGNKVLLTVYVGEPPFMFSAFKTHAIALTPLYYGYEQNSEIYHKKILEIRNQVLGGILNAIKNVNKQVSKWSNPEERAGWLTRDVNGKKTMNASAITGIKPGSEIRIDPVTHRLLTGVNSSGESEDYGNLEDLKTMYQGRERAAGMFQNKSSRDSVELNFAKSAQNQAKQTTIIPPGDIPVLAGAVASYLTNGTLKPQQQIVVDKWGDIFKDLVDKGITKPDKVAEYLKDINLQRDIPARKKK